MNAIPLVRRFAAVFVAVVLAAMVFHAQIAIALVTRGDDLLQGGNAARAEAFYDRALRFDATSDVAAERVAFVTVLEKRPSMFPHALSVAAVALEAHPSDLKLRNDRGLIYKFMQRYGDAYGDFARLATMTNDPHYYEFAAQMAKRAGRLEDAQRMFARVIALDPSFAVARRELKRLQAE